jgi:DNA-directed RNA polymerase subunit K/omega
MSARPKIVKQKNDTDIIIMSDQESDDEYEQQSHQEDTENIDDDEEELGTVHEFEDEEHNLFDIIPDYPEIKEDEDSDDDSLVDTSVIHNRINQGPVLPYMTSFEFAEVLAVRSQQLAENAAPCVDESFFPNKTYPSSVTAVALAELHNKRCPIIILRPFPDGTIQRVSVNDLIISQLKEKRYHIGDNL